MTQQYAAENPVKRSFWSSLLLGVVLILAGIFVLGDVVLATIISTLLIGVTVIIAGLFEVLCAIWAGDWRRSLWHTLLGLLYAVFGLALVNQPVTGSLVLTWLIGLILLASGFARIFLGICQSSSGKWTIVCSGLFGALAGFLILFGWPTTGLWAIGALLGIDLILHGLGWIIVGWKPDARASTGAT